MTKPGATPAETVLEIENLQTHFFTTAGVVWAVDGVSYAVRSGETLGVVGEAGCGKSVTALSILRLIADPPGRIVGGAITVGRQVAEAIALHRGLSRRRAPKSCSNAPAIPTPKGCSAPSPTLRSRRVPTPVAQG